MSKQESDCMQPAEVEVVNVSRRRLTTAALAGPVVLGTLASKQVLASGGIAYHCTVSGQISNSASVRPGEGVVCLTLGASPGCWKSPRVSNKGSAADGEHNWPAPYYPDMKFREAFGIDPPCGKPEVTLWQMLKTNGQFDCKDMFTRAAVASLLNAKMWGSGTGGNYPLSVDQVKDLYRIGRGVAPSKPFNQLFPGANPTTPWGSTEIMRYFESLYGQTNECPAGL